VVLWAYPREFVSADAAGQVRASDNRFTTIGGASHLFFLTQGYAVFDGPSMPIIGGDTANDTYVEQLVASARAAVDKLVDMGVADPDRIGVGGHSYGAFMTANLLAHSDLFRAGIARSGAYNRTLTPFGFQNEQRTYWEAPDVYNAMSPFMHAHRIRAAHPLHPRRGGQQQRHLPHPVGADVPRRQRSRRHRPPRHAPPREPRLPRPGVRPPRPGRDDRVVRRPREGTPARPTRERRH
jgi:hypothetical protein